MNGAVWFSYGGDRYTEVDRRNADGREPDVLLRAADGTERWWTEAEREAAWIDPKCIDCDEERGTCPGGRCRGCDIEYLFCDGSCRECHTWIVREEYGGPIAEQHKAGCPLRAAENYGPRDDAEVAVIRRARYGGRYA